LRPCYIGFQDALVDSCAAVGPSVAFVLSPSNVSGVPAMAKVSALASLLLVTFLLLLAFLSVLAYLLLFASSAVLVVS
jgi:hypothetical protein